jgi:hypothetical protein
MLINHSAPALEPVLVNSDARPHNIKKNIIEEALKCRYTCPVVRQQLGSSIRANDAKRQDLSEQQNKPELLRLDIAEQRSGPTEPHLGTIGTNNRCAMASNAVFSVDESRMVGITLASLRPDIGCLDDCGIAFRALAEFLLNLGVSGRHDVSWRRVVLVAW